MVTNFVVPTIFFVIFEKNNIYPRLTADTLADLAYVPGLHLQQTERCQEVLLKVEAIHT